MLGLCQDICCSAVLQSGLLKGSGFSLNIPVGIGRELLLMWMFQPCGLTAALQAVVEAQRECGKRGNGQQPVGWEWRGQLEWESQTSSAAEASLPSSRAVTVCFTWRGLV